MTSTSFKIVKICLMIKIKLLASKCLHYNFILQPIFQSAQHFYEKRQIREAQIQKDPSDPDPEHCIEDKPGKYKMSQRLLRSPGSSLPRDKIRILLFQILTVKMPPPPKKKLSLTKNAIDQYFDSFKNLFENSLSPNSE